jgi:hypothetical protein
MMINSMTHIRMTFIVIILFSAAACQTTSLPLDDSQEAELPTLFHLPSPTPQPTATTTDTLTPTQTLTATVTPSATITNTPLPTIPTVTPSRTPSPMPSALPTVLPARFVFGRTVQGRELIAHTFGNGPTVLVLVGGIHAGLEANTSALIDEMVEHFNRQPDDVLPGMTLLLIPALNPDGLVLGPVLRGRFNANNVDLNRNWACGWEAVAYFREELVSAGPQPFSEPETLALAALINDLRPATVLFYHAAADGIFAGECGQLGRSHAMAAVLGEATGYSYDSPFSRYPVTGTAPGWVDGLGIPSADVELSTTQGTEFERNLRGVMALQCWLVGDAAAELAACG